MLSLEEVVVLQKQVKQHWGEKKTTTVVNSPSFLYLNMDVTV